MHGAAVSGALATTLEDSGQGHGPTVAAVQLLYAICKKRNKHARKLRKCSSHIISRLRSLLRSSYDPDHDIGGVTDLFFVAYPGLSHIRNKYNII